MRNIFQPFLQHPVKSIIVCLLTCFTIGWIMAAYFYEKQNNVQKVELMEKNDKLRLEIQTIKEQREAYCPLDDLEPSWISDSIPDIICSGKLALSLIDMDSTGQKAIFELDLAGEEPMERECKMNEPELFYIRNQPYYLVVQSIHEYENRVQFVIRHSDDPQKRPVALRNSEKSM